MRYEDWPQRLDAAIAAARSRHFAYGQHDCWLFVADCLRAITGIDYAAPVRGYKSKEEAYAVIARYGSQEAMVTALIGREPIEPAFARRGDLMLCSVELAPGEVGESGGICNGVRIWTPTPKGLRAFPRSAARLAWRIE